MRPSPKRSHQAKALINLGVVQLQRSAPDDALEKFEEARQLCETTGDLANLSISLENLAVLYHRQAAQALAFITNRRPRRAALDCSQLTTAMNLADLYLTVVFERDVWPTSHETIFADINFDF